MWPVVSSAIGELGWKLESRSMLRVGGYGGVSMGKGGGGGYVPVFFPG